MSTTRGAPRRGVTASGTGSLLAAIAVLCACSALGGVLSGARWLPYAVSAVLVVAVIGAGLRTLRTPRVAVPVAQLLAVLCLTVVLFSGNGVLWFLPGPVALSDLGTLLGEAADTIRSGIAPIPATAPLNCLLVLALGAVAVLVDILVTVVRSPAIAGLPLLCVYAVPTALDDEILPWWSFALGVAGFALLLAVETSRERRRWRGATSRPPRRRRRRPSLAAGGTPAVGLALGGVGLLIALFTGAQATAIGTAGRLPGNGGSGGPGTSGQLGIKPFTTLRGMLNDTQRSETLFRVLGLGDHNAYLRALTLDEFRPDQGWVLRQPLPAGVRTFGDLPPEPGGTRSGPTTAIRIQPVRWNDVWLPVYSVPRALSQTTSRWHYDNGTGIVYGTTPSHPGPYTEVAMLAQPTEQQLRAASTDYSELDPGYLQVPPVSPEVRRLAVTITEHADSPFDKAAALYRYFTDPANGFTYSTHTAPTTNRRALNDFLFHGKTGFCEQYASSMAVMLRELGIPSRVAIGFTDGTRHGNYRTITSLDAHAWDEVYFPGFGWEPFDPTPLDDGRTSTPSYLATHSDSGSGEQALRPGNQPQQATDPHTHGHERSTQLAPAVTPHPPAPARSATGWLGTVLWALLAVTLSLLVLALLLRRYPATTGLRGRLTRDRRRVHATAAGCGAVTVLVATAWAAWWLPLVLAAVAVLTTPVLTRLVRRRRRLRTVSALAPDSARQAWEELLAESADRGGAVDVHETLRVTARKMARRHHLDPEGEHNLRRLIDAVERAVYGGSTRTDADLPGLLHEIRRSFTRNSPLTLRARLFPRSVLRRR